ncbi:copper chaperone [Aridibaculum aurantiacum]|uniref:copper chaperone n=1 Tax=Aridibaculum aurantiacum TaxID=2810307 RepID=UPI001A967694|nr:copper chaperone [Aridibaculum aurantiacum]
MKKLLLLLIASFAIGASSFCQVQPAKQEWLTIKTPNVRCWECKKRLEDYMAREIQNNQSGVLKMTINMLSGTTRVLYRTDRTNADNIKTSFNNAGFDADDMKATEDSYKMLPPQCKRVEEGGGPKKGKPCHMDPQYQ